MVQKISGLLRGLVTQLGARQVKRRRVPQNFENWAQFEIDEKQVLILSHPNTKQEPGRKTFPTGSTNEEVTERIQELNESGCPTFDPRSLQIHELNLDLGQKAPRFADEIAFRCSGESRFPIGRLLVGNVASVELKNTVIHKLNVSNVMTGAIHLTSCHVGEISVLHTASPAIRVDRCIIGRLRFAPESISSLDISGGAVCDIDCPSPEEGNPFKGQVSISPGTYFATKRRPNGLFRGPHGYRSVRAHLEKLQNAPAAAIMRANELKAERQDDTGLTKFASWFYDFFAFYGLRPGRPLWFAFLFYWIAVALILLVDDGGSLGLARSEYHGMWARLSSNEPWLVSMETEALIPQQNGINAIGVLHWPTEGQVYRSIALPLQSLLNPFGLMSARKLVVPNTIWGSLSLFFQGTFTAVMLFLFGLSIRRRFKLTYG